METLAIFYGGKSAEHDISIITAQQVMAVLDKTKYKIVPIYIDKNNNWHVVKDYENMNIYANQNFKSIKLATGFKDKWIIKKKSIGGYKNFERIDFCINCCHGLNGEDGTLSGIFELANMPYLGSSVLASSVGMDKVIMKDVFVANNVPCVKYQYFNACEYETNETKIIESAEQNLGYPIIVKPANLGSSIGINISKNRENLQKNIQIALNFDKKVILEQIVPNLREINCSVIGNSKYQEVSVLEEPKNWKEFLNFDEKYILGNKNGQKKQINVTLGKELDEQIFILSKAVFKILGCCGVVRIDFLLDDQTKQIYVNEINTIPGSYAHYLWRHKYTFAQLFDKLIDICKDEYLYRQSNVYAYESNVLNNYNRCQKINK
ncbi:MAG: D-alanine--D-alanine ligase [Clostridiales bacterium]|nr:D-alanine--D-alanine ligase [Clostridiales bacterium]